MSTSLLTPRQLRTLLEQYYETCFGARDTDRHYPDPAVNVKLFAREGKFITLQCHPLTGTVTVSEEEL